MQHVPLTSAGEIYRVGDLTIDTGRQRVTREAEEIALPKLSFDLLLALVRAAPNVVSLEQLMREVWANAVVSPETVSQRVKLLRDALDDDPHAPRYIAGLRGRGYRVVAPVTRIASPIAAEERASSPRSFEFSLSLPRRRWIPAALIAALVLVVAAGIVAVRIVSSSRDEPSASSSVAVSALPERTVAVLPFESRSDEAHDEFVALGIAEGVLHRLAGIRDLTVIARSSSFFFRGKPADAREIGLKLNARYLVEGSVRRSGDRLRVTAQLVDAASGAHVWSLRFDRAMADVFEAEDEISNGVARALEVSLAEREHPFAHFGTDAYLDFMQGKALVATRRVADAERAIERFSQAIKIAPDFAAAYVALADAHIHFAHLTLFHDSPEMSAAYRNAQPLLERALQLDDSLGEAYVLRADLKDHAVDLSGAEADYRKGLAMSPNYGKGHESFAAFLERRGRIDEALAAIDRARLVDPLTPRNHYLKGLLLHAQAATQEAEVLYLHTLQVAPDFYPALARLAAIRAYPQGRFAEAVKLAEQAAAIDPRSLWVLTHPVQFYLEMGDADAARSFVLEQTESARPTLWPSICLFERQPQRAADMLRANPERYTDVFLEDVETYVIRDAALVTGQLKRARDEILRLPQGELRGLYGTIVLGQMSAAVGDRREAERLARSVLDWKQSTFPPAIGNAQAIAFVLLGDQEAAIDRLEKTYESGWGWRWWYVLERELAFDAFRNHPRFQALLARARSHAVAQRALLDQMRERGEVPRRAASSASAPC